MTAPDGWLMRTDDAPELPNLSLHDLTFVTVMFLLGLGDPSEYRLGLARLVTPESLDGWGDFTAAAHRLSRIVPWERSRFTARDAADPDVAYTRVHADVPPGADVGGHRGRVVTLVRRPDFDGRWFVHDFGKPIHPERVPRGL